MLLSLALLTAGGCQRNEPLEIQRKLSGNERRAILAVHDDAISARAAEVRMAVMTPRIALVRPTGPLVRSGDGLQRTFKTGPKMANATVVVKRSWRRAEESVWHRLPPATKTVRGGELVVDFELADADPDEHEVAIEAIAVPPAEDSFTSDPVLVPPGSFLAGSYGLDPAAAGLSQATVEFRAVARQGDASHVLLDERLGASEPDQHGWRDYRLDLSRFAGQTVVFELAMRITAGPGEASAIALSTWSTPRILTRRPDEKLRNVILISLDTLRADYVGAYGERKDVTPNIDRLAAQGVLFANAYTTYPSTTAGHMSMLTGLYPSVHGIYAPGKSLAPEIRTLAETFSSVGYQTVAVTENAMLAGAAGFNRGFDFYREFKDESVLDNKGHVDDVVTSAMSWLDRHPDERFFMFLHTYQVHGPYVPPPAFDVFKTYEQDGRTLTVDEKTAPAIRNRLGYAGEVRFADHEIGRLLRHLDDLGESERTIVVVTSDHGEALGEHGVMGHGFFMMEEVLHVPLIIRAPGRLPEGVRVETLASLVDVAPTLIDLAGIASTAPMQGTSLVAFANGDAPTPRIVYSEKLNPAREATIVARTLETKWLSSPDWLRRYDMITDRSEEHPVTVTDAAGVALGREVVDAYRQSNEHMLRVLDDPRAGQTPVDDATTQKLRALGYIK